MMLAVGGSSLVAWQDTLGFICLNPTIHPNSITLLISLGSRCKVEVSITEIFVSIFLSLNKDERIKFTTTIIRVLFSCLCRHS